MTYTFKNQHERSAVAMKAVEVEKLQRGRKGKGAVFTTTLIAWSRFNPHPGHVVVSLDKTLYDHYLCLAASNKQQIYMERSQTSIGKPGKWSTLKRVRIHPK